VVYRTGVHQHEPAQVDRVQSVDVLVRVDAFQYPLLVKALRQRQLDQEAGARRVGVQLVDGGLDGGLDVGLRGAGRQVAAQRQDAQLGAVAVLAGHVRLGRRVVADQDGAEAGAHTAVGEGLEAYPQLLLDRRGGGLAVQNRRRHADDPMR